MALFGYVADSDTIAVLVGNHDLVLRAIADGKGVSAITRLSDRFTCHGSNGLSTQDQHHDWTGFMIVAAEHGHIDVLERIALMAADISSAINNIAVLHAAIKGGHLSALHYVLDARAAAIVVQHKLLDTISPDVPLLRDSPALRLWDDWSCVVACRSGNLDVIAWIFGKGCPFTRFASYAAAQEGHLDVLKWLHAKSCAMDCQTLEAAGNSYRHEASHWLVENGCRYDSPVPRKEIVITAASLEK